MSVVTWVSPFLVTVSLLSADPAASTGKSAKNTQNAKSSKATTKKKTSAPAGATRSSLLEKLIMEDKPSERPTKATAPEAIEPAPIASEESDAEQERRGLFRVVGDAFSRKKKPATGAAPAIAANTKPATKQMTARNTRQPARADQLAPVPTASGKAGAAVVAKKTNAPVKSAQANKTPAKSNRTTAPAPQMVAAAPVVVPVEKPVTLEEESAEELAEQSTDSAVEFPSLLSTAATEEESEPSEPEVAGTEMPAADGDADESSEGAPAEEEVAANEAEPAIEEPAAEPIAPPAVVAKAAETVAPPPAIMPAPVVMPLPMAPTPMTPMPAVVKKDEPKLEELRKPEPVKPVEAAAVKPVEAAKPIEAVAAKTILPAEAIVAKNQPEPVMPASLTTSSIPAAGEVKHASAESVTTYMPDAATCLDRAADYKWVQGRLQIIHTRHGECRVRYCSIDKEDLYGGSLVLKHDARLEEFKEGDIVRIEGSVIEDRSGRPFATASYRIDSIRLVEHADQHDH